MLKPENDNVIVASWWSKQLTIKMVGTWVSVEQIIDYSPKISTPVQQTKCDTANQGPVLFQQ